MSAHTPGPWKSKLNDRNSAFNVRATKPSLHITSVSWNEACPNVEYAGRAEAEANAALIAAAPELLEALKDVMEWVHGWDPSFIYDGEWQSTADKVDAAIAKATGAA